jgi:hypothetical protein
MGGLMKFCHSVITFGMILVLVGAVTVAVGQDATSTPVQLIRPDDIRYWNSLAKNANKDKAQLADAATAEVLEPLVGTPKFTMTKTDGPEFEIALPTSDSVNSPFELSVQFVSHGSPADPTSIRVTARKWIVNKFVGNRDITDSVRPFATPTGIHVPQANIPVGRYQITLHVLDVAKRTSEGNVILQIDKKS